MKLLDAKQDAKLNMYQGVEVCCNNYASIIVGNVAFNNSFQDFAAKLVQINAGAQKAGANLKGFAVDKSVSKKDLSKDAATMAGRIFAYAAKNGNNALKQSANHSVSVFLRLKDAELAPACQAIHDLADTNKTALADYGVTAAKLTSLQNKINAYAASVPMPRTAVTERKVTKAQIKEMFKQTDAILVEQMDKLVEDFAEEHPTFVAEYKAARTIVDPKKVKKQTGAGNGNPPA